jgi:predicted ArsR family transcriptional regulator
VLRAAQRREQAAECGNRNQVVDRYGAGAKKELLRALLGTTEGLSAEALGRHLGITPNTVRQHLAALVNDGFVAPAGMRRSVGRPEQLRVLTERGRELFARHYYWFAELLVGLVRREHGGEGLRERRLGAEVAAGLRQRGSDAATRETAVDELAGLMAQLGYSANSRVGSDGEKVIEAQNCVFHQLAMKDPDICALDLDLALLSAFTGREVDHQECMARGGSVCRFRFSGGSGPGRARETLPRSPAPRDATGVGGG